LYYKFQKIVPKSRHLRKCGASTAEDPVLKHMKKTLMWQMIMVLCPKPG